MILNKYQFPDEKITHERSLKSETIFCLLRLNPLNIEQELAALFRVCAPQIVFKRSQKISPSPLSYLTVRKKMELLARRRYLLPT